MLGFGGKQDLVVAPHCLTDTQHNDNFCILIPIALEIAVQ